MSWAPEVKVEGVWSRNALRFGTEAEALASAADLHRRWLLCTDYRATPADEPVNYEWVKGQGIRAAGSDDSPHMPPDRVQL